jgi:general secretion pathway protein G
VKTAPTKHDRSVTGFSSLELMLAVAAVGILAAFALPTNNDSAERASVDKAVGDIDTIDLAIREYRRRNNDTLPPDLNVLAVPTVIDPWGRPYQYIPFDAGINHEHARQDQNQALINSDFDLYSKGKDGVSASSLTLSASRDDIIRAGNGRYVGPAGNY